MELYFVKSLSPAKPPEGGGDGPWWKYRIECGIQGTVPVVGIRSGTREEVEGQVRKMLASINKRTMGYQSTQLRVAHSSPKSVPVNIPAGGRQAY